MMHLQELRVGYYSETLRTLSKIEQKREWSESCILQKAYCQAIYSVSGKNRILKIDLFKELIVNNLPNRLEQSFLQLLEVGKLSPLDNSYHPVLTINAVILRFNKIRFRYAEGTNEYRQGYNDH